MTINKSLEKFLRKKKRTGKDVLNYQTIFEEELENLRRYCNGSRLGQESELVEDVIPAKKLWEHLYPELAAPARYYQLSVREYLIKKVD